MKFRPCIDIHNGKVKQIVGSTLSDDGDRARENFVASMSAADYARMFRSDGLTGGHVIMLNSRGSVYYEATREEALSALRAYPGGLQIGGGITAENAADYLSAGASHVIVTSYVFKDGRISWENLRRLESEVGREHIVLDLSCRQMADRTDAFSADKQPSGYYIMTDRWQIFTETSLEEALRELPAHCDEFLVHGISVEGKGSGIDTDLVSLLGTWSARSGSIPVTYAGGIRSMSDIQLISEMGHDRIDYTVGSALDLFGGAMPYRELLTGA